MRALIERGLMFGNLIEVDSPVLVDRYNRALKALTGRETSLESFSIDISGFSPEIGFEFEDLAYLNHEGVNRQFILLTTDQKTAPLLEAKFSTSRDILRQFIEANEAQLFALTARDAVAGELMNSVYDAASPEALLNIRAVEIEADTTDQTLGQVRRLEGLIADFKTREDGWFDDVLIAQIIDVAKETGDVMRNPVSLKTMRFEQPAFWTSHFGGVYLFRDVAHPAVISKEPFERDLMEFHFTFNQPKHIAYFLELNGLAEPIVRTPGVDAAEILAEKMMFVVADVAARAGETLEGITARGLRGLARRYLADLPPEFEGLAAMQRWAQNGGPWPHLTHDHPAYFYTLRATQGPHRDLVNMLLAELAPLDFRQLFITHKQAFYETYANWPEPKQTYVAAFLEQDYLRDKAGARDALFGNSKASVTVDPRIARVGPWSRLKEPN